MPVNETPSGERSSADPDPTNKTSPPGGEKQPGHSEFEALDITQEAPLPSGPNRSEELDLRSERPSNPPIERTEQVSVRLPKWLGGGSGSWTRRGDFLPPRLVLFAGATAVAVLSMIVVAGVLAVAGVSGQVVAIVSTGVGGVLWIVGLVYTRKDG
ncbi:hypothetical protein [Rhodococcoides kroppenstedtii]|uniref:hypothetical protein n=1 Tax=Rhodococcoides kroppenstedtii TaxID=293050 RepID=UPI00362AA629